jgi:hypothetical protein
MKFKSDIEVQAGIKDSSGSDGTLGQVLSSTVSGVSWITPPVGVTGSGTTNFLPKWNSSTGLTDSIIFNNGNGVTIGATSSSSNSGWRLNIHPASTQAGLGIFCYNNNSLHGLRIEMTGTGDFIQARDVATQNDVFSVSYLGNTTANSFIKIGGTSSQYLMADGSVSTGPSVSGFVPYTGANQNVDLGIYTLLAAKGVFSSSGSANTVEIGHSSGSGIALNIIKGGNGEGLYINKTSGSGNAATIIGTLNATTLVKSGGTADQYLKADGSVSTAMNSRVEVNFAATSGQTTFTTPYEVGQIDVFYNGSKLNPSEFTATNGTTVVLAQAATLNAQVSIVKYVSSFNTTSIRNESIFTTTAGQTTFSVNYAVGQVDVFYNGSKLNTSEFTATNGTSVVLGFACQAGESIAIISYVNQVSGAVGTANKVAKFTGVASLGDSQIDDNGTNVSIGYTTNPNTHKLDVNGTGRFSGTGLNASVRITNTTASTGKDWNLYSLNNGNFGLYNNTDGLYSLISTPSGNVGIGVTPSAWQSDFKAIQLQDANIFSYSGNAGLQFTTNAYYSSGFKYQRTAGATYYVMAPDSHQWHIAPSGTAGNAISFTQAMTLDASGRLGIGTTDPQSQFVVGKSGNNSTLEINLNNNGYSRIFSYNRAGTTSTNLVLQDPGGNVLIGTTTDAGFRLNVETGGRVALIKQTAVSLSNGFYALDIDNLAHGSNMTTAGAFRISTNGSPGAFVVNGIGNVGIGTTGPDSKLNINSGGIRGLRIDTNSGVQGFSMSPNSIFGIDEPGVGNGRFSIGTNGNVTISSTSIGNDGGSRRLQIFGSNSTNASSVELVQMWNGLEYPSKVVCASDPAAGAASSLIRLQTSFFNGSLGTPITVTGVTIRYGGVVEFNQYGSGTLSTNSSGVISASDGRYKNKTRSINNAINKILNLSPTYYRWKEDCIFYTEHEELGFIAQEVAEVIPEASPEPEQENKYKNYSDRAIIAVLVKAIQEQQAQIKELQDEIISLKNK